MYYLLDENKQPYQVSLEESLSVYENPEMKIVQQDRLPNGKFVSTVFLCMDHSWNRNPDHKPVLFETMVFPDVTSGADEYMERYTSYEDALEGHKRALEYANSSKD
jgi:hypothetical protein